MENYKSPFMFFSHAFCVCVCGEGEVSGDAACLYASCACKGCLEEKNSVAGRKKTVRSSASVVRRVQVSINRRHLERSLGILPAFLLCRVFAGCFLFRLFFSAATDVQGFSSSEQTFSKGL